MLPYYESILRKGGLHLSAQPKVVRDGLASTLIDAGASLGHRAGVMGMTMAIEKAVQVGLGAVAVRNSHHFGAAGYYAGLAAERGFVGLVTSTARTACVLPTRGAVPRLGTNPMAFAAPARRNRPFVLDMSTSTVAANKVRMYSLRGDELPAGWVLDEFGEPVSDATVAMDYLWNRDVGGLTPLGGTPMMSSHKGYGLNLMVHVLSSTMSGSGFAPVDDAAGSASHNVGHFFLAIDPRVFRDDDSFEDDLDCAIDVLRNTPPVDPALPVLIPGDPEATTRRERTLNGVPLTTELVRQLRGVCERSGASFLLQSSES
jgi:LDH2 family malate/lactate/ureidoglycolate dehydrogenase